MFSEFNPNHKHKQATGFRPNAKQDKYCREELKRRKKIIKEATR